ncbi:MAG: hypothetical protein K6F69_05695, partial [Treponema sp.]|nr:hypothetical protein [Treponema sp.]
MTAYFSTVKENICKYSYHELEDCYNVFTINCESTEEEREAVKSLAELMPFSYIWLKISKESILDNETPLKVSMGLG